MLTLVSSSVRGRVKIDVCNWCSFINIVHAEPKECRDSETSAEEVNRPASEEQSATSVLEHSSQLVELLANVSSALELLRQEAQRHLGEQERQVLMIGNCSYIIEYNTYFLF